MYLSLSLSLCCLKCVSLQTDRCTLARCSACWPRSLPPALPSPPPPTPSSPVLPPDIAASAASLDPPRLPAAPSPQAPFRPPRFTRLYLRLPLRAVAPPFPFSFLLTRDGSAALSGTVRVMFASSRVLARLVRRFAAPPRPLGRGIAAATRLSFRQAPPPAAATPSPSSRVVRSGGGGGGTGKARGLGNNPRGGRDGPPQNETVAVASSPGARHERLPFLHEDVFVSNARKALDSILTSCSTTAAETSVDAQGGRAPAASASLASDIRELSSTVEAPYTYADDPLTAVEAAAAKADGEEELAFIAENAIREYSENATPRENPDVDAMDAASEEEATEAAPPPSRTPREPSLQAPKLQAPQGPQTHTTTFTGPGSRAECHQSQSSSPSPITPSTTGHRDTTSAEAFFSSYTPVNLRGDAYDGEVAEVLAQEAWRRGFVSPVWATRDSFFVNYMSVTPTGAEAERAEEEEKEQSSPRCHRAAVSNDDGDGDEEEMVNGLGGRLPEGVMLMLAHLPRPVRLFNLEQTNFPHEHARVVTPAALRQWVRRQDNVKGNRDTPRDLLGFYLPPLLAKTIQTHPRYAELSSACPLWISATEIRQIGAHLREGEEHDFAVQAHGDTTGTCDSFVQRRRRYFECHPEELMEVQALSRELGVDLITHTLYYNVHQLADRSRFFVGAPPLRAVGGEAEQSPPRADEGEYDASFFRCFTVRGSRYHKTTAFLMREYCRRYHFPTSGCQLWVSRNALTQHGGSYVNTPRTPKDAVPRRLPPFEAQPRLPSEEHRSGCSLEEGPATAKEGHGSPPDDEGVVPPPFTTILGDDLITLYNAEQTDIKELLWDVFKRARGARNDHLRGGAAQGDPQAWLPRGAATAG